MSDLGTTALLVLLGLAMGREAQAGAWETRSLGGTSVQLYVPTSSNVQGSGRGLMLVLHGCMQQNTSLRADGNLEPAAELHGVVIALPQVPNGGVLAGCWDYYGAAHTRTNKHNASILQIATALRDDVDLEVDGAQIYIAGLSSGAGQAAVSACLAPELFAGVGINAGPMVGTSSSEASFVAGTTAAGVATCRALAGDQSEHFGTQLASIIYGSTDFVVARGYGQRNVDVLRTIYGEGSLLEGRSLDVTLLPGFQPAGSGMLYTDEQGPRIEQVEVSGMGHAFPAGSGDGLELNFIARRGPSWPRMLAEFFSVNNRRIDRSGRPVQLDAGVSVDRDASPAFADASGSGVDQEEAQGCRCFQGQVGPRVLLELLGWSALFGLARRAFRHRRARNSAEVAEHCAA